MGRMGRIRLRLIEAVLDLVVGDGDEVAAGVAGEVVAFLSSHCTREPADGDPAFVTVVLTSSLDDVHLPPRSAVGPEDVFVRRSSSPFFTIAARRHTVAEGAARVEYVHSLRSGVRVRLDVRTRRIDAHVTRSGALDVVEILRDLALKHHENLGAVPVHATAAMRHGSALLIAGAKGSGKTTLLLELVERHGWTVLSGDRAFLLPGGDGDRADGGPGDGGPGDGVRVAGWPDYPHLGEATLAAYPGLPAMAGLPEPFVPAAARAFSPLGKVPLPPQEFRARFPVAPAGARPPLVGVLYPRIGPGPTRFVDVSGTRADRRGLLASAVESGFEGPHAFWTEAVADARAAQRSRRRHLLDAAARLPAWVVEGDCRLGAVRGLPPVVPADAPDEWTPVARVAG